MARWNCDTKGSWFLVIYQSSGGLQKNNNLGPGQTDSSYVKIESKGGTFQIQVVLICIDIQPRRKKNLTARTWLHCAFTLLPACHHQLSNVLTPDSPPCQKNTHTYSSKWRAPGDLHLGRTGGRLPSPRQRAARPILVPMTVASVLSCTLVTGEKGGEGVEVVPCLLL